MSDKKYNCSFCKDEGWVSTHDGMLDSHCPMSCKDIAKWEVELERCRNGVGDMSGHEYFYYNYFTVDGKRPAAGSYSGIDFSRYRDGIIKLRDLSNKLKTDK